MQLYEALTGRRTWKVIGERSKPLQLQGVDHKTMDRMLNAAGNAPFHYPAPRQTSTEFTSAVPWRAYVLERPACLALIEFLEQSGDTTKVSDMLAAAEALIQVTWIPEGNLENELFVANERNMEHLAAASAFAQSMLLAITCEGYKGYWSSGGPLKNAAVFERLGIPSQELLIGALFVFPSDTGTADVKPGKLAGHRGELGSWCKRVVIGSEFVNKT